MPPSASRRAGKMEQLSSRSTPNRWRQVSELADEHDPDHDEHDDHDDDHEHEQHEHEHDADAQETLEAMLNAIREAPVAQLIVSSISTFASAAYGKLGNKDLAEAKVAIDSIAAL